MSQFSYGNSLKLAGKVCEGVLTLVEFEPLRPTQYQQRKPILLLELVIILPYTELAKTCPWLQA